MIYNINFAFYFKFRHTNNMESTRTYFLVDHELCIVPTIGALLVGWYSPKSWCSICPTGTFLKIFDKVVGNFKVTKGECNSCGICDKACPMTIEPSKAPENSAIDALNCTQCGICVGSCPKNSLALPQNVNKKQVYSYQKLNVK